MIAVSNSLFPAQSGIGRENLVFFGVGPGKRRENVDICRFFEGNTANAEYVLRIFIQ